MTTTTSAPTDASPAPTVDDGPAGTGSTTTRVLGLGVLVAFALLAYLGLAGTPEDRIQGPLVRLLYVHPQTATAAYIGCFLATVASVMYLWKRSDWWDIVAVASAEIAAVFTALALATGALWGRPSWGTYWVWDARLTSTAMLMLLLLGYLALRKLPGDIEVRARQAAVVGLMLVPNVVLVRQSVVWWRTLHQVATIDPLKMEKIQGLQAFTMSYSFLCFSALFLWLVIHRFRIEWLSRRLDEQLLVETISARRREGAPRTSEGLR